MQSSPYLSLVLLYLTLRVAVIISTAGFEVPPSAIYRHGDGRRPLWDG